MDRKMERGRSGDDELKRLEKNNRVFNHGGSDHHLNTSVKFGNTYTKSIENKNYGI
jgi:hypothetical protein